MCLEAEIQDEEVRTRGCFILLDTKNLLHTHHITLNVTMRYHFKETMAEEAT